MTAPSIPRAAASSSGSLDPAAPIALLDNVSYQYPTATRPALLDVSLQIRRGEFLGIIGPTGAGKTTLCLCLNGIVPQFFGGRFWGRAEVAGLDTLEHPIYSLARHVGQVFEDPETQLIATSVENEVAFALENLEVPREEILLRVPRALEAVGLTALRHKVPAELSGGQKQRLAVAAALATRPRLLVLDEPTAQLDPEGTREMFATLRDLNRKLGMTIVLASHAAEELAECCDRIALLIDGRIAAQGPPAEIYGDVDRLLSCSVRPPQAASVFHLFHKKVKTPEGKQPPLPTTLRAAEAELESLLDQAQKLAGEELVAPQPLSTLSTLPADRAWSSSSSGRRPVGTPLLAARDVGHAYSDGTIALSGVNLEIQRGEYVMLVGQNGAGKSTLVKMFMRLLEPTSGSVLLDGRDARTMSVSDLARRIGYVAQNPDHQIFSSTVFAEVAFALRHLGFSKREVLDRVEESLSAVGLLEVRDAHPLSLPRGDRARVVIAAVLAMRPEILLFDEPTTGQDFRGARYILDLTRELHRAGKTVIVVTHHLYLMPEYAERVIILGEGKLRLDAPLRRAYHEQGVLARSALAPPQAVQVARHISEKTRLPMPMVTPREVASYLADWLHPSNTGGRDAF